MAGDRLHHDMLVYDSDDQYAERVGTYFEAGFDTGEALVAVPGRATKPLLQAALGSASERVSFHLGEDWYTRPEVAVAAYDTTVRTALRDGATGLRVVAELPFCQSREEWNSWLRYEAIINVALADCPVSVMCTLDSRVVPGHVVDGVRHTHPHVISDRREENPAYRDPAEVLHALRPSPEPLPELHDVPVDGDSQALRAALAEELARAGVAPDDADAMVLAASEVVVNAMRHGNGVRSLRAGSGDGTFVCEISDAGDGLDDPFAGYVPPTAAAAPGAGLWVARQLTRRLDLVRAPGGGLTARLWI
jgi:anti-sigma regulatory factor (Ser/Thr protein kinase)